MSKYESKTKINSKKNCQGKNSSQPDLTLLTHQT